MFFMLHTSFFVLPGKFIQSAEEDFRCRFGSV